MAASPSGYLLNEERKALQIRNCTGAVVGHVDIADSLIDQLQSAAADADLLPARDHRLGPSEQRR
jgi:hypothetical protein